MDVAYAHLVTMDVKDIGEFIIQMEHMKVIAKTLTDGAINVVIPQKSTDLDRESNLTILEPAGQALK